MDYKILQQSKLLIDIFGDLTGKLCYENYMGLDIPCDPCPMAVTIKSGKVERAEMTGSDGRNYEIFSAPLPSPDGSIDKAIEVVLDISERKQAEEALWNSNEKLTALFQSSPLAIITLDPDGNVTFWNPEAEKIFGWGEKEVIGRFLPFVTEGKKSEHHALRNRVLSGEGFHDVEALRQKKNGSDIYVSISTVPLKDSTGSIRGIMSVIVDITERKRIEEEREKLIHELQNALAEIKTLSGLLPICVHCKNIRDDKGYWDKIESYIHKHSDAEFSHGICPECARKYYPDMDVYDDNGEVTED